ncbi:MAG: hypothetical protein IT313_05415 [Anaerolineales bacterium]|nr:hypothetical protein [Anaerolineales bacterium]
MNKLYSSLLRNKFLILILLLGLISFLILFLAETYLALAPRVAEILRSVAAALLTSGVVGFVFDYQTRKEFAALLASTVQDELLNFERRFLKKPEGLETLHEFWQSFLKDGLSIIIPEDEAGVEPTVRAADISAAIILYTGVIQRFGWQKDYPKTNIEFVPKNKHYTNLSSFERNLVIIGAPGANPLSRAALNIFYNLQPDATEILNGYVFSVDSSRPQKYLENLHIVPCGENKPSILEMQNGKVINQFERYESKHVDGISTDSCLLVYGAISGREGRVVHVLVIAGHSRFSGIDGIEFVLSNEKWAEHLTKFKGNASATVLTTSKSIARGRVVSMAQSPHSISSA